jgi:hypothetical protein
LIKSKFYIFVVFINFFRKEEFLGMGALRAFLHEIIWKSFKDCLPELRKQLAQSKKTSTDLLKKLKDQAHGNLLFFFCIV